MTMRIFIPKETDPKETRIPILPDGVKKLKTLGAEVSVESTLGNAIHLPDSLYEEAGAHIVTNTTQELASADLILRLNPPPTEDISKIKSGAIHISFTHPFTNPEYIHAFANANVSAIGMEMIPRSTIAQKMDALSSQASLAGYIAVILAADHLEKILPMMMTPSGTIHPARVFVIGAGVAGLQAIATAKRLGARVDAFDTRPEVQEQIQSLGAKFVKVNLGETGSTKDGYAKQLTLEQLQKQQEVMAKVCSQSDIVITTAALFGKKAPTIITQDMIKGMKPGSIMVDLAIETGGNIEGAKLDEVVDINGVKIIAYGNLPRRAPVHASQMYSNNLTNFIEHFWNAENACFDLNLEEEILNRSLVTHEGKIVNEFLNNYYANQEKTSQETQMSRS